MTCLITFTCYGCHLHGDEAGSVDRSHCLYGTPVVEPEVAWQAAAHARMNASAYTLDAARATVVLEAIREVCRYRAWQLIAAHVRSTHVHVIVAGEMAPERMMRDFKVYASRALHRLEAARCPHWTRHGSTRWLWKPQHISAAWHYAVEEQGKPMVVFCE